MMTRKAWLKCGEPQPMLSWLSRKVNFEKADSRQLWMLAVGVNAMVFADQKDSVATRMIDEAYQAIDGVGEHYAIRQGEDPLMLATEELSFCENRYAEWVKVGSPREAFRDMAANMLRDVFGDPNDVRPPLFDATAGAYVSLPWLTPQVLSLVRAAYDDRRQDGTLDAARLAVLSDALEEAGCDDADILRHLRGEEVCPECLGESSKPLMGGGMMRVGSGQPMRVTSAAIVCDRCLGKGWIAKRGPCYRGCHVVDRLLGKA